MSTPLRSCSSSPDRQASRPDRCAEAREAGWSDRRRGPLGAVLLKKVPLIPRRRSAQNVL
ncbi:MAG: hypothetical protein H7095_05810 [Pseudopedobacter sp.]|nr:hypothetical protein [Deinococcales bacterium]